MPIMLSRRTLLKAGAAAAFLPPVALARPDTGVAAYGFPLTAVALTGGPFAANAGRTHTYLRFLDADFRKVNARHNRGKMTNFLMADGHCESIETKSLPHGPNEPAPALTQAQITGSNLSVWAPWPYPKWRTDQ